MIKLKCLVFFYTDKKNISEESKMIYLYFFFIIGIDCILNNSACYIESFDSKNESWFD